MSHQFTFIVDATAAKVIRYPCRTCSNTGLFEIHGFTQRCTCPSGSDLISAEVGSMPKAVSNALLSAFGNKSFITSPDLAKWFPVWNQAAITWLYSHYSYFDFPLESAWKECHQNNGFRFYWDAFIGTWYVGA